MILSRDSMLLLPKLSRATCSAFEKTEKTNWMKRCQVPELTGNKNKPFEYCFSHYEINKEKICQRQFKKENKVVILSRCTQYLKRNFVMSPKLSPF